MSRTTEMDAAWRKDFQADMNRRRRSHRQINRAERQMTRLTLPQQAHEAVTESRAVKLGGGDE